MAPDFFMKFTEIFQMKIRFVKIASEKKKIGALFKSQSKFYF